MEEARLPQKNHRRRDSDSSRLGLKLSPEKTYSHFLYLFILNVCGSSDADLAVFGKKKFN
jgi:hypothetical protein